MLLQEIFRFSLHFKTAAIPHSAPFSEKSALEMSSRKRQIPLFALPGRLPIFVPYFLRYFDKIEFMRQFFGMAIRLHFSCQTRLSLSFFPAVFIIFEIDSPLFLISRFLLPTAPPFFHPPVPLFLSAKKAAPIRCPLSCPPGKLCRPPAKSAPLSGRRLARK